MTKIDKTSSDADAASSRKLAIQLIIIFGVISLFSDMIYEGARSVNGPYLKTLGANAAMVGLIAGLAEMLGYVMRLVTGTWADKSKAYWVFTIVGYGTLITVPLLAIAGTWQTVAILIVLERVGKAIRSPAKDTILSTATRRVGTGFGFGLHEAMDQTGAILGPLFFAVAFAFAGRADATVAQYQAAYRWLWLPFGVLMVILVIAFIRVPDPEKLEPIVPKAREEDRLTKTFWLYVAFTFVTTLGFASWALLGFHFKSKGVLSDAEIPLFYAIAMGVDGVVALLVGLGYDKLKKRKDSEKGGLALLVIIPLFSIAIPFLGFSSSKPLAIAAAVVWGIVMGTHETIMKSAIADITPMKKRGTGYGIFNTAYGLAVFAGSSIMGLLYDASLPWVIGLSVAVEIAALVVFFFLRREALGAYRSN
jgi:MFS-type transporter involved in bile tolerance (Atg22 family)